MKKLIAWFMSTRFYKWALYKVVPFIRFSMYYTKIRGWQYHQAYALLQPGDFILTIDKKKLTTILIPGEWTHAAQCISKDGIWEISEMTHHDYTKSCFFDLCKEADRLIIMRCVNYDPAYIDKVIEKCKSLSEAKYDVEFGLGVEALYCSELVYQSDVERRLDVDLSDLVGLGRQYISPTGLRNAKNCVVVYDTGEV